MSSIFTNLKNFTRRHRQLRSDLVECAWTAKRTDLALSLFYSEQLKKGKEPKLIIVKIARKLLSRIRYVWLTEKQYEKVKTGMKKSKNKNDMNK